MRVIGDGKSKEVTAMTNDAFVSFWAGVLVGGIVGVFLFAVILAIRAEFREKEEKDADSN